jgi:S-methylmethionine-dependent homocysteine/selenocysteine methylase
VTTIAVKDGEMACDSCWTDCNWLYGTSMNKITRLKSGALLGEAGDNDSRAVVKLLQNCKTFDQLPTAIELSDCKVDYAALILFPDGTMAQISIEHDQTVEEAYHGGAWPVNRGCSAVGTGAAVAIGAMRAGKSAREAVAIACGEDPNSKLPVHSYRIEKKPVKKRVR